MIFDKAGSGRNWAQDLRAAPLYDPEVAAGFFARIRVAPARQSLAAAIYSTRRITSNESSLRGSSNPPNLKERTSTPSYEQVWILPMKESNSIGLPHLIRRRLVPARAGRAEPNFPLLRWSFQNSHESGRGSELLDWTHCKHRIGRETHAVLVSTEVPRGSKYAMAHCMFVLEGESIPSEIEKTPPSLTSVQHFDIDMNETNEGLQSRPKPRLVTSEATKLGARLLDFHELLCKICSIYI